MASSSRLRALSVLPAALFRLLSLLSLCCLLSSCQEESNLRFENQINLFAFADAKPDFEDSQLSELAEQLQTQRLVLLSPGAPIQFTGFEAPALARLELEWVPPLASVAGAVRLQVHRIDTSGARERLVDERMELTTPFGQSATKWQWPLSAEHKIEGLEFSISPYDDALRLPGFIAVARPRIFFEYEIPAAKEGDPAPRQIILVTLDTFRSDYLGCYGNTRVKTPNFDALAEDSSLFTEAYSTANVTKPSHYSIFTSIHLKDHRVDDNFKTLGAGTPSMIEALGERGFRTAAFLAAYNFSADLDSFHKRFDDYFRTAVRDRRAGDVNADVIPWMVENRTRDFFAWIHYFDAHAPYTPPYPYSRMYQEDDELEFPAPTSPDYKWRVIRDRAGPDILRKLYMGEVSYIDNEFGKLVARLKLLGIYAGATIIVTADHGDAHGELGLWAQHRGLTDGTTHVPLLIKRPFGTPHGRIGGLVSTLDIYPTLFDWLGFEISHPYRGTSLRPLMEKGEDSAQSIVFSHHAHGYQVALRTRDQRAVLGLKNKVFKQHGAGYAMLRDRLEIYDYTKSLDRKRKLLPMEGDDVAGDHPDLAQRYRLQLEAFLADRYPYETGSIEDERYIEKLEALGYVR